MGKKVWRRIDKCGSTNYKRYEAGSIIQGTSGIEMIHGSL